LVIGGIQGMGLLAEHFSLSGGLWNGVRAMQEHFDILGFAIVGFFALLWGVSATMFHRSKVAPAELKPVQARAAD
jgi:nickel/cobalt transporter (NiCoT) family protein